MTLGAIQKIYPDLYAPADMTLGLFVEAKGIWEAIEYVRVRRKGQKHNKNDIQVLFRAKEMVKSGGFLYQHDDYRDRLPQATLDILAARYPTAFEDWRAVCAEAEIKYRELIAKVEAKMKKNEPPSLSEPKRKLITVMQKGANDFVAVTDDIARAQLDECAVGFRAWAFATRKFVRQALGKQAAHRSRAWRNATYHSDNTGSIRFVDGRWEMHTHREDFKNGRSDLFKDDPWVVVKLEDVNGFYDKLHDYTRPGGARDWILDGRKIERRLDRYGP